MTQARPVSVPCLSIFEVLQAHSREQKPAISLSPEERVNKTSAALKKNFESLQFSRFLAGNRGLGCLIIATGDFDDLPDTFHQISKFDQLSNFSLDYSSKLSGYFQSLDGRFPGFQDSSQV
jgi:hypothetical protein